MLKYFVLLIISNVALISPICEEGVNHCTSCNPITKLCVKCDKDVFSPDEKGGCSNSKKCIVGNNNCLECNDEGNLCKICADGYFQDENGGCSYTNNCEVSYRGQCLKCKENYIFVGQLNEGIQICKSLDSEDLKNCQKINIEKGICEKCKDGFYLNQGDKRCTKTSHCYESSFGTCRKCTSSYYLYKRDNTCVEQKDNLKDCQESLDGVKCDLCRDEYYLAKDGKCTITNYCSVSGAFGCEECVEGFYLSEEGWACTNEENCKNGKRDIGICLECKDGYTIDFKDGKCKPNHKDDEFKYCEVADEVCKKCIKGYYLGLDNKCSFSRNCSESNNGVCHACADNYYLGLDNKCTEVEHCIYSDDHFACQECEGKYYFNQEQNKCFIGEGELENCKFSYFGSWCTRCKDDFYLNQTEFLCRSNSNPDYFYKCAKTHSGINLCSDCVTGYYLGRKDNKCSKIQGCERSENENKCLECNEYYCLDLKTGRCEYNHRIDDAEKKFYYKCNRTNEAGTACEVCLNGYTLNENGLCVNEDNCEEKNGDGSCAKCISGSENLCLNKDFGCVHSFYGNCLECNDVLDFSICTKCAEGYHVNDYGKCV